MFERYTERARRVLFFSRYEASQLGHRSIETEHLLLGLLREGKGITSKIFDRARLSFDDVHLEVEKRRPPVEKLATSVEIPFTAEAKRVLHYAAEEADRLLHNYIGTEHLLLGLLREERSVAWSILNAAGLKVNAVRDDIVMLLNQFPHGHADEDSEGGEGTGMVAFATLKLAGYTTSGHELHRNVLFDQLFDALPKDPQAKVQIYNAEIAPGGYTNWHCHNGATFFIALQGVFEAEFQEGVLIRAKAGDVYSEPIGQFHRGHNPHPTAPYICIGVCLTPPDKDHVTNVSERPW